jgi:AcrR family transcriptional regulator
MDKASEARTKILDAARQLLATSGGHQFTTRRVAAIAGMSHGMCHYHFATKSDLLTALIEQARQDWTEPLEKLVGGTGAATERAHAVIAWMSEPATLDVMRVHQALFGFALDDAAVRERLAEEYGKWRASFTELFADVAVELSIDDFDSRGIGAAFAAAADGLVEQQSLDPTLDSERYLTALFERLIGPNGAQSKNSR